MPSAPQHPSPAQGTSPATTAGCPAHATDLDRFPLPRRHPFDPPPAYAELGRDAPVRRVVQWNGRPAWFVTRYDLIKSLLMDKRLSADATHPAYPAQNAALALVRREYQVFAQMDPPAHTAERGLFAAEFSVRQVEALRPKVQALVDALIDRLLDGTAPPDFVESFAMPLPVSVICELLGVPPDERPVIQHWARVISSRLTTHEQAAQMTREFCDGYLTDLVRRKNADPQDDLLSRLIVDHMRTGTVTERKVASIARLFLTAGHESTTGTLAVGMAALLYHPEQWAKLCADPALLRGAVEEILRYTDITHSGRLRIAKEDLEIGGVAIRAGEAIVMHQATADRDPELFPDPHRFDITRAVRPHLAFGTGIHQCIGQPLARMELQVAYGTLARRMPTLRATQPLESLPFHHTMAIYGLESLPIAW